MKKIIWIIWIIISLSIAAYFGHTLLMAEDKSQLLIGDATHGHHQIELACESCHTDAFGGGEVLQNACLDCHKDDLNESQDSHPAKKFRDPSNADLLEILDARHCVSCHTEHQKEQTQEMGVTLPNDYCYHCHVDIGEERPSHKDLPFDSCASAGCHNYHDNRALYENFLTKHAKQDWLKSEPQIAPADYSHWMAAKESNTPDFAERMPDHPDISSQHLANAHGEAGITCGGCHAAEDKSWIEKPGLTQCQTCHQKESQGFVEGKHGMRQSEKLSQTLPPITPAEAAPGLAFHSESMNTEQGCATCHAAHDFNTQTAAVESCLGCHADEHSMAFNDSPHGQLWAKSVKGEIAENEAVSCATCHMPRLAEKHQGKTMMRVQHNQNWNLRPNEKMIRSVCMECHSLEFSIDALADPKLIQNNFNGQAEVHIESMDWALKRE